MFISKKEWEKVNTKLNEHTARLRELVDKTNGQERMICRLRDEVNMLSCEHKDIEIVSDEFGFPQKICKKCSKVFKTYMTQKELLEDLLEYHKEKVAEWEEKLKRCE